jgi:hypothetical protein
MFSHLGAVLLATGALVLVGTLHTAATANPNTGTIVALVAAPVAAPGVRSAQMRAATGASLRMIAIGY